MLRRRIDLILSVHPVEFDFLTGQNTDYEYVGIDLRVRLHRRQSAEIAVPQFRYGVVSQAAQIFIVRMLVVDRVRAVHVIPLDGVIVLTIVLKRLGDVIHHILVLQHVSKSRGGIIARLRSDIKVSVVGSVTTDHLIRFRIQGDPERRHIDLQEMHLNDRIIAAQREVSLTVLFCDRFFVIPVIIPIQ